MIIKYHSTEDRQGAKHREWDITRTTFELTDKAGNRYRLSEYLSDDRPGICIQLIEGSQGIPVGLNVVPVSENVAYVEARRP